jgi:hypothetical protein
MPRQKSEDQQKIEKILREEQDKEAGRNLTALQQWWMFGDRAGARGA